MNVIVVIPAYNEERTVGEVIRRCQVSVPVALRPRIPPVKPRVLGGTGIGMAGNVRCQVLVVDDGSSDRTAQVARESGATVVCHPINRGLGAALATGIEATRLLGAEIVVTLDGDGQHDPAEIADVIKPIIKGEAEVVIGSRLVGTLMPWHRRAANFAGNFFTWLLFGIWVSDSQSGFRAFRADVAARLQLRTSTMEVSSEIIREIKRNRLRFTEVPITVRYTPYSLSKGQGLVRGLETLWKLIALRFFR